MADERERKIEELTTKYFPHSSRIVPHEEMLREAMDWQRELDAKIAEGKCWNNHKIGINACWPCVVAAAIRGGSHD